MYAKEIDSEYIKNSTERALKGETIKRFCPYAKSSLFFSIKDLYQDKLQSESLFKNANIYFIVDFEELEIVKSKTRIWKPGYLQIFLKNNEEKSISEYNILITEIIDISNYLPASPDMNNRLITCQSETEYRTILNKHDNTEEDLYCIIFEEDNSSHEKAFFSLYKNNQRTGVTISIPSLLTAFNYKPSRSPNVLYIGQSKDFRKRITSHSKLQKIIIEKKKNVDIYIYTLFFQEQGQTQNIGDIEEITNTKKYYGGINKSEKIDLMEMCLINYFKPKYNIDYVNTNILSNNKVKDLLKINNFTDINLEIRFDESLWWFGSDSTPPSSGHGINYCIK